MAKIFITGAAGFIGSHLSERLLGRGDVVVGIDNFDPYYPRAIKERNLSGPRAHDAFSFTEADICDGDRLAALIADASPDVVVHLAAKVGVRPSLEDPNEYHRVNVIGSQHVLDACRACSPSHLVQASSSSVYGALTRVPFSENDPVDQPISPYAATKRMNELMGHVYSRAYGMNVTMLRFFTAYGPRQRPDMAIHKFTRLIDAGESVPMYGSGDSKRDYTYIDDIIDGVVAAVDRPFPFEIFNLGESQTTALSDMIGLIGKHLDREPNIERAPMQKGDVEITYADVSKARAMLDYSPSCALDEGIRRFVAWYKGQVRDGAAST